MYTGFWFRGNLFDIQVNIIMIVQDLQSNINFTLFLFLIHIRDRKFRGEL